MAGELFPFFPEAVQMTPKVARKVVHHVAHGKPAIVAAKQGLSMLALFTTNLITAIVVGGGAWYVRGRGMTGVKIDIQNIKNEINKLKATPAVPVVTPPPAPAPVHVEVQPAV